MGLVNKADGVRFHTVFLYGFLCSESKVLAKWRAQRGWMCPLFFTVTSTPHGSVYRPSELNTLPRCQLYARCARDHEATHVRFAHGTESVLKVGREELMGAVMLASPMYLSHDLTIDAAAPAVLAEAAQEALLWPFRVRVAVEHCVSLDPPFSVRSPF